MAAPKSNSHLTHRPFTTAQPAHPPGPPDGAGSSSPEGRTDAVPRRSAWGAWLVRLCFCAGLTAVTLVLMPVAWRLGERPRPAEPTLERRTALEQPAAEPRQNKAIEADVRPWEDVVAALTSPPGDEGRAPDPGQAGQGDTPPARPGAAQADEAFERRLRASEKDLRAELRGIPEVRLMSDDDVRLARGRADQAAQKQRVAAAGAAREVARVQADAANAQVNAFRAALNANRRNAGLARAEREASTVARVAQRAFHMADRVYRQAVAGTPQERGKVGYEASLRLHRTLKWAAARAGLPLRSGPACQLDPFTATQVAKLSKELRDLGFVSAPGVLSVRSLPGGGVVRRRANGGLVVRGLSGGGVVIDSRGVTVGGRRVVVPGVGAPGSDGAGEPQSFAAWCDQHRLERMSGTVPTLTQMLQVEDEEKRLLLVRELTRVPGERAAVQLAVRAIADLSPAVRRAAVAGLAKRPWRLYGPVLLRGLRYPWPRVADHAAVALKALNRPEAVAPLVGLLDLPSPSAPVLDPGTKKYAVRELVRLNHLRNCLLCHTPSADKEDGLVRGLVPTPGERLPALYYKSQDGNFVRADRTLLRQDFSTILTDDAAYPWPREQRYDFVTRLRTVPPGEVPELSASGQYPQREAVLYALRGLTGRDGGDASARWRELLGLTAGQPKGGQESPSLEPSAISLTDPGRPALKP